MPTHPLVALLPGRLATAVLVAVAGAGGAEQVVLVSDGRGSMPGFGSRYAADELEAVVRYTREVL